MNKVVRGYKVDLLVYGSDRPYFKQNQKNITKFWPTFFLKKEKETKHNNFI